MNTRVSSESRERLLALGWDLSEDAIERAELLINDGFPLERHQAKQLATFLEVAAPESYGRRVRR